MRLEKEEIQYILNLISDKEGLGYSKDKMVGKLQGKLSIMLEACG